MRALSTRRGQNMGKKKGSKNTDKSAFEAPEYEKLTTIEEVDALLQTHKDRLVTKDITESKIKADKKEYTSAINEQLKELGEEREHEMGVIGALNDRRRVIAATNVVPLKPPRMATP